MVGRLCLATLLGSLTHAHELVQNITIAQGYGFRGHRLTCVTCGKYAIGPTLKPLSVIFIVALNQPWVPWLPKLSSNTALFQLWQF